VFIRECGRGREDDGKLGDLGLCHFEFSVLNLNYMNKK